MRSHFFSIHPAIKFFSDEETAGGESLVYIGNKSLSDPNFFSGPNFVHGGIIILEINKYGSQQTVTVCASNIVFRKLEAKKILRHCA